MLICLSMSLLYHKSKGFAVFCLGLFGIALDIPDVLAVLQRGHAYLSPEQGEEVLLAGKAARLGDALDRIGRLVEHLLGMEETDADEIVDGRNAQHLAKRTAQILAAEGGLAGQLGQRDGPGVVCVNIMLY